VSGDLWLRPVDPGADADLLHAWVDTERAVFWGMVGKDREEVEAIYAWIVAQPHLAAYLLEIRGERCRTRSGACRPGAG
jgi:penicillin amidase